jgi:hypothetical protein
MKIAFIACGNGLGHIKRVIKICNEIYKHSKKIQITLFCESWQLAFLEKWTDFLMFKEQNNSIIKQVSIPIKWNSDPSFFGPWLLDWHKTISSWNLQQYDHVVSDNLIEPILYSNKLTLSGSFLWHDVLIQAFPKREEVRRYHDWCNKLLSDFQPVMIANKYFAMPNLFLYCKVQEVGIINFNQVIDNNSFDESPKTIQILFGLADNAGLCLDQIKKVVIALMKFDVNIVCSSEWYQRLSIHDEKLQVLESRMPLVQNSNFALIVGGLGTISDCIASKMPIIFIPNGNPELTYNLSIITKMGVGISSEDVITNMNSPITDKKRFISMVENFNSFTLNGEKEVVNILCEQWGGI